MDNRSTDPVDELDALLDGRTSNVPEDLAPLLEAAQLLRALMQAHELDATVAAAHLARIVGANPAQAPARLTRPRWQHRIIAIGLAALALISAVMAAGAALPGDLFYPLKRAIERVRLAIAVTWNRRRPSEPGSLSADVRSSSSWRRPEIERDWARRRLRFGIHCWRPGWRSPRREPREPSRPGSPSGRPSWPRLNRRYGSSGSTTAGRSAPGPAAVADHTRTRHVNGSCEVATLARNSTNIRDAGSEAAGGPAGAQTTHALI
jgi:hypothetical protein